MEHAWRLTRSPSGRSGEADWECRRCGLMFTSFEGGSVGPADPYDKFILYIQGADGPAKHLEMNCDFELVRSVMRS